MKVEVVLVAIATNVFEKQSSHFLLCGDSGRFFLPAAPIAEDKTCEQIAEALASKYTGVVKKWAFIVPLGVNDDIVPNEERIIRVIYALFIPEPTRIREPDSQWVEYKNAKANIDSVTLGILNKAMTKRI